MFESRILTQLQLEVLSQCCFYFFADEFKPEKVWNQLWSGARIIETDSLNHWAGRWTTPGGAKGAADTMFLI